MTHEAPAPRLLVVVHKVSLSRPGLHSAFRLRYLGERFSLERGVIVIMRQGLLWLSERQGIFNFVRRNGMARKFASRFVAGETIETGVQAAKELSRRDIAPSLDLLGESVKAEAEAVAARDLYLLSLIHI